MHKIYDMQLHDKYTPNDTLEIVRVPGGWIYYKFGYDTNSHGARVILRTSTFVPFNNEFQK